MSRRYVLVSFLDPHPVGQEFSGANWPPHLTLLPNFSIDLDESTLYESILSSLRERGRVVVPAQEEELFGPSKTVLVTVLEPSPKLLAIHANLLGILTEAHARLDHPEYVGLGYRPHVTVTSQRRLERGALVVVNAVSIVDLHPDWDPGRRRVLATIPLNHA